MRLWSNGLMMLAAAAISMACADPYADHVNREDVQILRAMVDIACKLNAQRIVVSDRPAIPYGSERDNAGKKNIQFGLDFGRRQAREARWPRREICPAVRVAADSQIAAALAKKSEFPGSWEAFIAQYDGARTLMKVSLPVYSQDGKRAVVYTTSTCPYVCGGGFFHELVKTYEGWKIENSQLAWTRS